MGDLIKRDTVTEVVQVYLQAVADIKEGFELVHRAEKSLHDHFSSNQHWLRVRSLYGHGLHWDDPSDTLKLLRRDMWGVLVDRLELKTLMSNKAWREFEKQLEADTLPEITVENVLAFGQTTRAQIPQMIEDAVKEVFQYLRPPHSEYKTNTEFEIGKKVILAYPIDHWSNFSPEWRVQYPYKQDLLALERVFQLLDGGGMVNKSHKSDLEQAIEVSNGKGETPYFKFKCYKKGTLHLEFKRLDLVKRLNEVAGGLTLKTATTTA